MDSLIDLLAQRPMFSALSEDDRREAARRAVRRDYQAGEFCARMGDVWPYLLLVETGAIHAVKESSEGRNLIVATLGPGDVFWGPAFFHDDVPMLATLEAVATSRLYLWDRQRILPMLLQNGPAVWELCRLMIGRMARVSEIVEELAFQPVANRLARLLLDHFGEAAEAPVARDLTLDEMAAHIGTTREMVCRVLYHFADQKIIHITRTEFALNDRAGLARLAGR